MKTNLSYLLIIAVLLAIIVLQRECNNPTPCLPCTNQVDSVRTVDTVYVPVKVDVSSKPKIKKKKPSVSIPDSLKPVDTTYKALAEKYKSVVKEYATQNIYEDSINIDSVGYIILTDTVQYNKLQSRKGIAVLNMLHIKERVVVTERIVQPAVRQLYVGGGLNASQNASIIAGQGGVLYKTKHDHIYGITVGIVNTGQLFYGFQTYWKIRLKK